jgi:ADP-dependent NAD(P)H-hydrate dehydratase / NAD(P)H-hydrate epimerase
MKPLVLSAIASSIDANAKESFGLSDDLLMESAAAKLYQALKTLEPWKRVLAGGSLVAVCGKGNNAGDALAVVRKAAFDGHRSVAAIVPPELNAVAVRRLEEARRAGVRILALGSPEAGEAIDGAAILLDGIAGTGMKGNLRAPYDRLATAISSAAGAVVAIDVPSGICLGSASGTVVVSADYTLSIAPSKLELYLPGLRRHAGTIHEIDGVFSADSGADSRSVLLEDVDLSSLEPPLSPDSYKGSRGALGIYAGAVGTTGAAVMAARAGTASGAGTVTVMCREDAWPVVASSLSAQMARPLSAGSNRRFSAVLAGPGWGLDSVSSEVLAGLLDSGIPLVLDADGLRMLASDVMAPKRQSGTPLVLTPHPGEFAGLVLRATGKEISMNPSDPSALAGNHVGDPAGKLAEAMELSLFDTPAILQHCAAFYDAVVVLKNHVTWIAAPDGRLAVWDGQEPALGTGGSGDVLAGLVAGLMARGAGAYEAACAGVIAHGLAGREAAAELGFFDASVLPAYAGRILYRGTVHGNKR